MHLRKLVTNAAWLALGQAGASLVPLLALPVALRALGPETFGLISTATAWASCAGILVAFGFNYAGPREVASAVVERRSLAQAVSPLFWAQFALSAVAALILIAVLVAMDLGLEVSSIAAVVFIGAVANALIPTWAFTGLESPRDLVLIQLVTRLVSVAGILLLVNSKDDALVYVAVGSIASTLAVVASFVALARKGVRLVLVSTGDMISALQGSFKMFVSTAAVNIYTTCNVLIVSGILGQHAAGIYALADRLRQGFLSVFPPMTQAIYPFVCRTLGRPEEGADDARRAFFMVMLAIAAAVSAVLYVCADQLVLLFGGAAFAPAADVVRVLALAPLPIVASNILAVQTLLPRGRDGEVSLVVTAAAVGGAGLFALLVWRFGLQGGAFAYLLTETAVALGFGLMLLKRPRDVGRATAI